MLGQLVGLGHHGCTGLLQDLSAAQVRSFLGKVRVHNTATSSRQVFSLNVDIGSRVLKAALQSTQIRTGRVHLVNGAVDLLQSNPSVFLGGDSQLINTGCVCSCGGIQITIGQQRSACSSAVCFQTNSYRIQACDFNR